MSKNKFVEKLKMKDREELVLFLKKLIAEQEVICPICKVTKLEYFHKKAKKSNTDWFCKNCGERFKVIDIMNEMEWFKWTKKI